jgi:hypothetical protein
MYYDERKDRLKARKERFEKLNSGELSTEERRDMLRENMRNEWSRADYRQKQRSASNLRTLILIAILVALGYFVFNGVDEVDVIVEKIW